MKTSPPGRLSGGDLPENSLEQDDAIIAIMLRRSLGLIGAFVVLGGGLIYWLTRPDPVPPVQETPLSTVTTRDVAALSLPQVSFTEITDESGIAFVHENGAAGEKLLPETMGSGCAFFDYDGDGDQDLLLINSQRWPWDDRPVKAPPAAGMALYENDGSGHFTDVTDQAGLSISCYGVGCAVGDFDNDGRVDLFVSALGRNHLFHNEGQGRFRDVTGDAGVAGADDAWSTSCGWFDFDRDGDLDLFVCNYVVWSRAFDVSQNFQLTGGSRAYGRPQNFEGTFPYLYRNEGQGRFVDVTQAAGLQVRTPATDDPMAKSLGVTFADIDQDGWLDIVVANDTVQNFLFHNQQDGTFAEVGALAGVAFDMNGNARGAMGIDAADFRNTQGTGIAIGNFANEMTALYVSDGAQMAFVDEAISTGLGPNTRLQLTFGVFYFDYDLDGRLDLFAANGHLEDEINRVQPSQHYEQAPQLFWNCGPQHITEFFPATPATAGEDFFQPMVGRGASYADIDGDGDLDVLITAVGRKPRLLRNHAPASHHWLRVKLRGQTCNWDAIGAVVEVEQGSVRQRRCVLPTRSYASQVELPVTFGLGQQPAVDQLTVYWPDGQIQRIAEVPVDQLVELTQPPASTPELGR